MRRMGIGHQRDDAGNADGAAADHRMAKPHRLAVAVEKQVRRHAGRCGLAAVPGGRRSGAAVVEQQESAAADAGTLRFDQGEHELDRDCRIDRVAAGAQHRQAGGGGVRLRRHHHMAACSGQRPALPAAGCLRRRARLGGGRERAKQAGEAQRGGAYGEACHGQKLARILRSLQRAMGGPVESGPFDTGRPPSGGRGCRPDAAGLPEMAAGGIKGRWREPQHPVCLYVCHDLACGGLQYRCCRLTGSRSRLGSMRCCARF